MDERSSLLRKLEDARERLNQAANRQREQRDRMNDTTRTHAQRRDELNRQVRALVDQANAHKAKRDELNAKVREAKAKRDELNKAAHEKSEALNALRRERGGATGPAAGASAAKLRAEIKHLEFQQQTMVLTPKKEKELIDLIASKLKELKEREGALESDVGLKSAWDEMKAAKAAAEAQHAAVTQLATEAQAAHDAMSGLFRQADDLRRQADAAQADFVKSKTEADAVHREYIDSIGGIRDAERVLHALRGTAPRGPREPTASAQDRAEADEIFDKFRKGEKLSTEDLMALQKAGRL